MSNQVIDVKSIFFLHINSLRSSHQLWNFQVVLRFPLLHCRSSWYFL